MDSVFKGKNQSFLVAGRRKEGLEKFRSLLRERYESGELLPADTVILEKSSWGIDDSHFVSGWERRMPLKDFKIAALSAFSFTPESQNALLKTIEDSKSTKFVVFAESASVLLPTLRSRLFLLTPEINLGGETIDARRFLSATPGMRLAMPFVKKLISAKNEEEKQDREAAIAFVRALEPALKEFVEGKNGASRDGILIVKDFLEAKRYLRGHGASLKLIIEHLALSLPVTG